MVIVVVGGVKCVTVGKQVGASECVSVSEGVGESLGVARARARVRAKAWARAFSGGLCGGCNDVVTVSSASVNPASSISMTKLTHSQYYTIL